MYRFIIKGAASCSTRVQPSPFSSFSFLFNATHPSTYFLPSISKGALVILKSSKDSGTENCGSFHLEWRKHCWTFWVFIQKILGFRQYRKIWFSHARNIATVPRAQKVEGPSAAGFPPPHSTQLALLSPICFTDLKGRELATRLCNPRWLDSTMKDW
jgi:hypothetical protein